MSYVERPFLKHHFLAGLVNAIKLKVMSVFCAAFFSLCFASSSVAVNPEPDDKLKFANGTVYDIKFLLKHAYYNDGNLLLKSDPTKTFDLDVPAFVGARITFPRAEKFAGKTYNVVSDERMDSTQTDKPNLTLYSIVAGYFSNIKNNAPYDLKLQFYQPTKGLLPGYIDLKIKDSNTTWIRGYFYAEPLK